MEHSSDRETEDDYQEENQCLNEQEKDELLNRLLLEVQELRRSNNNIEKEFKKVKKNKRLQREKVKLDLSCSNAVRKVYRQLVKQKEIDGFNLERSFQLDVNQEIGRKIADEVAGLYTDKWSSSTIERSVKTYFQSLKDDSNRKAAGVLKRHRSSAKRNVCMKRKLEARRSVMDKVRISEDDRKKARHILYRDDALEYVFRRGWGRGGQWSIVKSGEAFGMGKKKLRNIKAALDRTIIASRSTHQKRVAATVVRSQEVSSRPKPKDGPQWAVRC